MSSILFLCLNKSCIQNFKTLGQQFLRGSNSSEREKYVLQSDQRYQKMGLLKSCMKSACQYLMFTNTQFIRLLEYYISS